jgi:hypothetical protein
LIAGSHSQKDTDGVERIYDQGDIFDSTKELDRIFGRDKFDRVPDYVPATKGPTGSAEPKAKSKSDPPQFEQMNVKQLLQWAEAEELDLGLPQGKTQSKDEIVKAIRAQLQPA